MADAIGKFQQLLRDLFQFDCAELDFGIYRIMNYKREVLKKFIAEKLPDSIASELDSGSLADQAQIAEEMAEVAQQIEEMLGEDALDANGNLSETYHDTRVGKKYLKLKKKAVGGLSRAAVEVSIYNHLYAFFSRYYQDGDFISKRRYSKHQRYAIPYNGEEVYLHWANSDQYYIKTGEHFHDYDWKASDGVAVRFRIKAANVEQNNVKGDKRFFLPLAKEAEWDADARAITIPFEYRPLTATENKNYGTQKQDKIIKEALEAIPKQLSKATDASTDALAALTGERRRNGKDESVSHLEHHLRQYTQRNTSDFFIHKNLAEFLSRELDFYLKSEVLDLDEMAVAGEGVAESWFQQLQLIKLIGDQVIEFLAQMENFQKMLWEKRKFVTETQYCIALGSIDENFYSDIAACEAQWAEWKALFHIDEDAINLFNSGKDTQGKRIAFMQAHPTLVLDTRHFDAGFTDCLLASFDDLDGMTDGLLIHGENYQALNLLQEKYAKQVKCIYIDPLYNTGKDGFLYKDHYQHSTWLSMMDNLMPSWLQLLANSGSFVSHIDEHEFNKLEQLISMRFGPEQNVGPIVWDKRNPKGDATAIASQHEYLCWAVKDYEALKMGRRGLIRKKENAQAIIRKAHELVQSHQYAMNKARDAFKTWMEKQNFTGGEKAYSNLDDNGDVYQSVSMSWPNSQKAPEEYFQPLIHPTTGKPCPVPARGWRNTPDTMKALLAQGLILFGPDETTQPRRKYLLQDNMEENVPSIYYFGGSDQTMQNNMGYSFPNPKPVRLAEYVVSIAAPQLDAVTLDCFAGSGTTGHAVINLNREDGGQRKFILVEMGEYFDTVLLPRIKKIAFAPEWKDGKPKRDATPEEAQRSPRIVQYIRLESYEDALDSIAFDREAEQLKLEEQFDDYLIKYMLQWETKGSATLLNVAKLARPFTYSLRVHTNGETQERAADVPETFNYLLGLNVRTRRVYEDGGRRYLVYRGETRDAPGRDVAVIWRETEGWEQSDFERDRQFVAEQELAEGAATVYVNGDSCIPRAVAVEPTFKARMFAEVAR